MGPDAALAIGAIRVLRTIVDIDAPPRKDVAPLPWGAFLLPLIALGTYLLMKLLPAISPREFAMTRFVGAFESVLVWIIAFMALLQVVLLQNATDPTSDPTITVLPWVCAFVGLLLLVVANYLTKTQPNFFFGIRTPWTLANQEVWFRTHRQGAYLFALSGLIAIVTAPFQHGLLVAVTAAGASTLWLVLYSYLLYRRLDNDPGGGGSTPASGTGHSTSTPTGQ